MENFNNTYNKIQQFMHGGAEGLSMAEDPTFLTFSLDFQTTMHEYGLGLYNSPLFGKESTPDVSAETYLRARGFEPQADRIAKFNSLLLEVSKNMPWYFQSIKGLDKLWLNGSDMSNNYKAKEAVLEISTLESYDLKISYLADLYRKAAFDGVYMRELLPVNLRHFELDVYVAEFRHIRELELGKDSDLYSIMSNNSAYFKNNATYFMFKCYQCEFDFSASIPGGDFQVFDFDAPAANSFKIKVGWFLERHAFSFYDIMTVDRVSQHINGNTEHWKRDRMNMLNGIAGNIAVASEKLNTR